MYQRGPLRSVMDRIEGLYSPEPNTGCWLWTGALNRAGYGLFHSRSGSNIAHRVSYELHRGPIPDGLTLDHLCRVRCCINPDHLEPVSMRVNTLRGTSFAATNATATHCPKGHPLSGKNIRLWHGSRACVLCNREATASYRASIRNGDHVVRQSTKSACPKGHPYSGENLIVTRLGHRACRLCARVRGNAWMREKRRKVG